MIPSPYGRQRPWTTDQPSLASRVSSFADEPALAHAGHTEDGEERGLLASERAASGVEEHGQLFVPTRQRGLEPRDAARTPDFAGYPRDTPAGKRRVASRERELAQWLSADHGANLLPAVAPMTMSPGSACCSSRAASVHRVARGHGRATERVADDDLARLDPDPCLQPDALARLRLAADLDHALADRQRGADGTFRIVLVGLRQTEDGHHRVAAELLDGAAALLDLLRGKLEELADQPADDLRIELLAERRGASEVGEQRRHDAPFLHADARHEARAAAVAEARTLDVRRAAACAVDHGAILCVAGGRRRGRWADAGMFRGRTTEPGFHPLGALADTFGQKPG